MTKVPRARCRPVVDDHRGHDDRRGVRRGDGARAGDQGGAVMATEEQIRECARRAVANVGRGDGPLMATRRASWIHGAAAMSAARARMSALAGIRTSPEAIVRWGNRSSPAEVIAVLERVAAGEGTAQGRSLTMPKISRQVREEAIEVCECSVTNGDVDAECYDWAAAWLGHSDDANDLAFAAWRAVKYGQSDVNQVQRWFLDDDADLEAAALLRDGWCPGDPVHLIAKEGK